MKLTIGALVLTAASALVLMQIAQANGHGVKSDPGLLAALRSDRQLSKCNCILAAVWLNESYARVVVDATNWKGLGHAGRARFTARALGVAEATFLTEFGVPDQYEEIFVVDQTGRPLSSYHV
jgi:hypothetical protein